MSIRFLFGGSFLEYLVSYRLIGIEGRLGAGKTLLAVALAKYLYDQGLVKGVFANFPIDPTFVPTVATWVNSCVILDEAWAFADARKSANKYEGYGAYARKLNSFLLCPSKNGVDKRMSDMVVFREADVWVLNSLLYRYEDRQGVDKGRFLLSGYEECYGRYEHGFIPWDDGGIKDTMMEEIKRLAGSTRRVFVPGQKEIESPWGSSLDGGKRAGTKS